MPQGVFMKKKRCTHSAINTWISCLFEAVKQLYLLGINCSYMLIPQFNYLQGAEKLLISNTTNVLVTFFILLTLHSLTVPNVNMQLWHSRYLINNMATVMLLNTPSRCPNLTWENMHLQYLVQEKSSLMTYWRKKLSKCNVKHTASKTGLRKNKTLKAVELDSVILCTFWWLAKALDHFT